MYQIKKVIRSDAFSKFIVIASWIAAIKSVVNIANGIHEYYTSCVLILLLVLIFLAIKQAKNHEIVKSTIAEEFNIALAILNDGIRQFKNKSFTHFTLKSLENQCLRYRYICYNAYLKNEISIKEYLFLERASLAIINLLYEEYRKIYEANR